MNKSFIERHPDLVSIGSVVVWFAVIALLAICTSCKPQQHIVEVIKTDTLHVYHTDTLKVVHNDTIYSVKVETKHDSIIIKEKYYLDAEGNVTHSEKEKEAFHNFVKDAQFIQHTVDSILQAKIDSINHSSHEQEPVIIEVEKPTPWYTKIWNWIISKFAWIGLGVVIVVVIYVVIRVIKPKLHK